jgi:hypothetical protein
LITRRFALTGFLLSLLPSLGCGSRSWGPPRPGRAPLPKKIPLYVAISRAVENADDGGMIAALVESLESDLREDGYEVAILVARADESPPVPRIELQVLEADGGNQKLRGAGNLGGVFVPVVGLATSLAGAGRVVVDCYVVQGNPPQVTFSRRFAAGTFGESTTGYSTSGAESTGSRIASAITP